MIERISYSLIKSALELNAAYVALVGQRTFYRGADEGIDMPYVVMSHVAGGLGNNAAEQDVDQRLNVTITALTSAQAGQGSEAIFKALHRVTPVGGDNILGYCVAMQTWITHTAAINDMYLVQNRTVYLAGGTYRIRYNLKEVSA